MYDPIVELILHAIIAIKGLEFQFTKDQDILTAKAHLHLQPQ